MANYHWYVTCTILLLQRKNGNLQFRLILNFLENQKNPNLKFKTFYLCTNPFDVLVHLSNSPEKSTAMKWKPSVSPNNSYLLLCRSFEFLRVVHPTSFVLVQFTIRSRSIRKKVWPTKFGFRVMIREFSISIIRVYIENVFIHQNIAFKS